MKRRANLNVSNLSISIPLEDKNDISFSDFQTCECFNEICKNRCCLRNDGELGAGIGGTVSKVYNKKTGDTWAKKVLTKNIHDSKSIQHLLKEIETLKTVDSPFCLKTYGAIYRNNRINCFMEFMDMGSLDVLLYKTNRVPERVLSRITRHVVRGLDYLYEQCGISHRDVKPSNILINMNGNIKLCDFGISSAPEEIRSTGIQQQFFGTPAYMSPERLKNMPISHRIEEQQGDIWSLGITVLQLAIGDYPLPMPSEEEFRILHEYDIHGILPRYPGRATQNDFSIPIIALMAYFDEVSPNLPGRYFTTATRDFIRICLQKLPENRKTYPELNNHTFLYMDTFDKNDNEFYRWLNTVKRYLIGC